VLAGALIAAGLFQLSRRGRFALGFPGCVERRAAPAPELSPIVGDLTITYLYPQYTGLPARTEEGTAAICARPAAPRRTSRPGRPRLAEAVAVVNGKPVKLLSQGPGRRSSPDRSR